MTISSKSESQWKDCDTKVTVFSGGVGGSKLVQGLYHSIPPENLTVITNPGDDIDFYGLRICPDTDIILYTLGNLVNQEKGWGLKNETFNTLETLKSLGEEAWFNLGDRDFAIHILRSQCLASGKTLTEITKNLCQRIGVQANVIPPTNQRVKTLIKTPEGTLNFQEFYVREKCRLPVQNVSFEMGKKTRPTEECMHAINSADLIIFAPSNPIASIGPILEIPGIREAIQTSSAKKVSVCPIVGGKSLKGPSDRMLECRNLSVDPHGVEHYYSGLIDKMVVDHIDHNFISQTGIEYIYTSTVMKNLNDKINLANEILKHTV